jgi:large subunit ribosomal protein L29
MATKKYIELTEMSDADLLAEMKQISAQFQKLSFDHTIKGLDNPLTLKIARKDIARIQTEVRRREVDAMTPEQKAKRSKIRQRRKNG